MRVSERVPFLALSFWLKDGQIENFSSEKLSVLNRKIPSVHVVSLSLYRV